MESTLLSDQQLYEIIRNKQISREIRIKAEQELERRNLSVEQLDELSLRFEKRTEASKKPLPLHWKIVLVIFPFFIFIHNIVASLILDKGQETKWKQYWFYVSLGFLLYTILIFVFAKKLVNQ